MKHKPTEVNILGNTYSIEYTDSPSEVDLYKRESLWGQIDFWTRTIRVYDKDRALEDLWETILHEVLHGIGEALKLDKLAGSDTDEDFVALLALGLKDVFVRNGWLVIEEEV